MAMQKIGKLGPTGAVTADHVATEAGVSRWTVNRAFRQDASISEKSRKKVIEAAEKLGYVPDLLAASMRSERSNLVAVLVDDFANPHKLIMMERLTRILRKHGWDTLLVNMLGEADTSSALLSASQRRVDAAILIGVQFNDEVLAAAHGAQRVKKLIIFARNSENPETISICCDDVGAMSQIADYVLKKGFERPLFLAGPQTDSAHLKRKETFLQHWQQKRGTVPPNLSVSAYDPIQANERLSVYLQSIKREAFPDIIVCENDALAMGAVDAVRFQFGLRIPEDIAITGFDDVPQAASPNYRLTTYRQPLTKMAESLVEVLKGSDSPTQLCDFLGELIVRESA